MNCMVGNRVVCLLTCTNYAFVTVESMALIINAVVVWYYLNVPMICRITSLAPGKSAPVKQPWRMYINTSYESARQRWFRHWHCAEYETTHYPQQCWSSSSIHLGDNRLKWRYFFKGYLDITALRNALSCSIYSLLWPTISKFPALTQTWTWQI